MLFPRCDIQPAGGGLPRIGVRRFPLLVAAYLSRNLCYRFDGETPMVYLGYLYFTDSLGNLTSKRMQVMLSEGDIKW